MNWLETQSRLDSTRKPQATTDAELKKVKLALEEFTERHQASEKTLQDELDNSKTEISKLKKEATTASRRNISYQAEIEKLKAEEATTMRYPSSENVQAKAQNTQLERTLS